MPPIQKPLFSALPAAALLIVFVAPLASAQARPPAPDKTLLAVSRAQNEGRLLDAQKILRDAISETQANDPKNPHLGDYLRRLASLVGSKDSSFLELNQRAIEADRNALGPTDLRIAYDLTLLGSMMLNQSRTQDAEQYYEQAREIAEFHLAHLKTVREADGAAAVFAVLARFYAKDGRPGEADVMTQQLKKACDQIPPHPGVILVCDMEPATQPVQRPSIPGTPVELARLDSAAAQYEKDGLYPQAEVSYREAITWIETHRKQPTGIVLGITFVTQRYNWLGRVLVKEGLNSQAEAIYKQAIQLQEADAGNAGSIYSFDFMPLLNLYRAEHRLSDIEPIMRNALEVQQRVLGSDSPRAARTMVKLAGVYEAEGANDPTKYPEAQALYERAVEIEQKSAGSDAPPVLYILRGYLNLLRKSHQDAKAAEVQARINAIERRPIN
jgi:tetratricopeptide (TPR) repeat protein